MQFRNHMSDMHQWTDHIQQIQGEILQIETTIQKEQENTSQRDYYLVIQQQMNDQLILSILQEQEKIERQAHEINQLRDKTSPKKWKSILKKSRES